MKKEMNKRRFLPLLALPLLLLAGCSKDGIEDDSLNVPEQNGNITFEIGFAPQTRVSTDAKFKSEWEDGDAIGIFAVEHGEPLKSSDNRIHNVKLTYDGSKWTALSWPNDDRLDFYAYYPYADATDPTAITFNVKADQSAAADYSESYLLTAKSNNSGKGWGEGPIVRLTFSHALAMVQVTLTADRQNNNIGAVGNISVSLRRVKTASTLNLSLDEQAVSASGDDQIVNMYRAGETAAGEPFFRALVPAQEVEGGYAFLLSQFNESYNAIGSTSLAAGQAEIHGIEMPFMPTVKIEGGEFLMGSSNGSNIGDNNHTGLNTTPKEPDREGYRKDCENQHWVRLMEDFQMSKYEITNAQYAAFLNDNDFTTGYPVVTEVDSYGEQPLIISDSRITYNETKWSVPDEYKDHPVNYVTWYGAYAYAKWVGGALPTEAQWEYACRGGKENEPFGVGTGYVLDNTLANFNWTNSWSWNGTNEAATVGPTGSGHPGTTQKVGSYPANAWGLYDMHGNVYEWCLDQWDGNGGYPVDTVIEDAITEDPLDVSGDPSINRVLRGGSWYYAAHQCRSAYRGSHNPAETYDLLGFRVILPPDSPQP